MVRRLAPTRYLEGVRRVRRGELASGAQEGVSPPARLFTGGVAGGSLTYF